MNRFFRLQEVPVLQFEVGEKRSTRKQKQQISQQDLFVMMNMNGVRSERRMARLRPSIGFFVFFFLWNVVKTSDVDPDRDWKFR